MLDVLFMIIFVPLWGYLTYKIFNAYRKSHTMISDGPISELNGWFGVLISVGIIAGIILTIPCLIIMSLWKSHPKEFEIMKKIDQKQKEKKKKKK